MATLTTSEKEYNEQAGLPDSYTAILNELKKGPLTALPISDISRVSPAKTHVVLNNLVGLGIVQKYRFYSKTGNVKAMYAMRKG